MHTVAMAAAAGVREIVVVTPPGGWCRQPGFFLCLPEGWRDGITAWAGYMELPLWRTATVRKVERLSGAMPM